MEKQEPLISIIVPVYNVEKYLAKCIDHLIGQTYQNLEIILVDDGSTDSSGAMCDEYAGKDSRISVIHKENGGQGRARNKGLDIAKGEYIMFCDSDDFYDLDMAQHLYEHITMGDYDIAMCGIRFLYANRQKEFFVFESPQIYSREDIANIYFDVEKTIASPVNKLYKKTIFEKLRYPEDMIYEDRYLGSTLFMSIDRALFTGKAKYNYYIRRGSTCQATFNKKQFDLIKALQHDKEVICQKYPLLSEKAVNYLACEIANFLKGVITQDKQNEFIKEYDELLDELKKQVEAIKSFDSKKNVNQYTKFYKHKKRTIFMYSVYYKTKRIAGSFLNKIGLRKRVELN